MTSPNPGRRPPRKPIPVALAPETVAALDQRADEAGLSRSELMREAIAHALACDRFQPRRA